MSKNDRFRILREKIENVLREHFTRDPQLNAEIEEKLSSLQSPMKQYVGDAAENLHAAGTKGLSPSEWIAGVRAVWPEIPKDQMVVVLSTTSDLFKEHIYKNPRTKITRWYDEALPREHRASMVQSIELASECLKVITTAAEPITLENWASTVATNLQYPIDTVKVYIEVHMLPHMGSAISKTADGRYFIQKDPNRNNQDIFNDLLNGPRLPGVEDEE